MLKGIRLTPWQQQLVIAVAFCVSYLLLRTVALPHWMPQSGLWLGGVLLLPRRFWPALMASNIVATVPGAYACFDQYGWVGSLLHMVPVSAFAMLVVQPLRTHLPGTVSGNSMLESVTARHIVALLGCTFAFALLSAADSTLQYILTFQPQDNGPALIQRWAPRYLLLTYLGCLTVVPLALAIHEAIRLANSWSGLVRQMGRSRLLFEGIVLGLACVALLTAMGAGVAGEMWRQAARMAMFMPVAWMAVRYGWEGAAVGGTAASVGIMFAMPAQYDPATMDAQTLMAFCLTLLLPLGAKINWLNEKEQQLVVDHRQLAVDHQELQQAARREIYQGEMRLRRGMEIQGQAYEYIREGYVRLLERVRDMLPEEELHSFRTLRVMCQRLVCSAEESFLPASLQWDQLNLPMVLSHGPIAETLEECAIDFAVHVSERASRLSPGARWTVYRLACEAVARILMQSPGTPCIHLQVRVVMTGPERAIPKALLVVAGAPDTAMSRPLLIALPRNSHLLLSRLGALGLNVAGMRDRARLYQGRVRSDTQRRRLSMSVLDAPEEKADLKSNARYADNVLPLPDTGDY